MVTTALQDRHFDAWDDQKPCPKDEPTRDALNRALATFGWPALTAEHQQELVSLSDRVAGRITDDWQQGPYRALRQNALLQLIAVSPDMQLS